VERRERKERGGIGPEFLSPRKDYFIGMNEAVEDKGDGEDGPSIRLGVRRGKGKKGRKGVRRESPDPLPANPTSPSPVV